MLISRSAGGSFVNTCSMLQEFAALKPEEPIYKLMGKVLVRQDRGEASTQVEHRLSTIKGER